MGVVECWKRNTESALLHCSNTPLLAPSHGESGTRTHDGLNIRYGVADRCLTNSAISPISGIGVPECPWQDSNLHHSITVSRGRNPVRYRGINCAIRLSERKWRDSNPQERLFSPCFRDRRRYQSGNTSTREREDSNLRLPSSQPGALSSELLSQTPEAPRSRRISGLLVRKPSGRRNLSRRSNQHYSISTVITHG